MLVQKKEMCLSENFLSMFICIVFFYTHILSLYVYMNIHRTLSNFGRRLLLGSSLMCFFLSQQVHMDINFVPGIEMLNVRKRLIKIRWNMAKHLKKY